MMPAGWSCASSKRKALAFVFEREGGRCFWCSRPLRNLRTEGAPIPDDAATLDHIVPKAEGGSNQTDNLVLACFDCNNDRGSCPAEAYLRIRQYRASRSAA